MSQESFKEHQEFLLKVKLTQERAVNFNVPLLFAKVVSDTSIEHVFGFAVEKYDFLNCSDNVAIATLFGTFKKFQFSESNGIQLLSESKEVRYFNLDSHKLVKLTFSRSRTYDSFAKNSIQPNEFDKLRVVGGRWDEIVFTDRGQVELFTNEEEIALFKRYELAHQKLQLNEEIEADLELKKIEAEREKFISNLNRS